MNSGCAIEDQSCVEHRALLTIRKDVGSTAYVADIDVGPAHLDPATPECRTSNTIKTTLLGRCPHPRKLT